MREKYGFMVIVLLLSCPAHAEGFDIVVGTGVSKLVGPDDKIEMGGLSHTHMPYLLGIGYSIKPFRVSLEGMASFPFFYYNVSVVGSIDFASSNILRGYSLLGIGYGENWYFEGNSNDGDVNGSGFVQLQAGVGIGFFISERIEIGTEARIRMGVPENPDLFVLTLNVLVTFKLQTYLGSVN